MYPRVVLRAVPFFASCDNCLRRASSGCSLGNVPDEGSLICGRYEITPEFRDEIVSAVMKDLVHEIGATATRVQKLQRAKRMWN
ncbi:MAG: hypothetical protein ACT4PT_03290 [Methanobacteriota archaeon]